MGVFYKIDNEMSRVHVFHVEPDNIMKAHQKNICWM